MQKPLEGEIVPPDESTPVDSANIPFSQELVAAYYCALDKETPFHARATLLGALAYFVLPIDIVPDFIIGLGFSDDITILAATLLRLRQYITDDHRDQAKKALDDF